MNEWETFKSEVYFKNHMPVKYFDCFESIFLLSSFENNLLVAPYKEDIFSNKEGFLKLVETRKLGIILIQLGGGRKNINDIIDYRVGFDNLVNVGEKIDSNKPLLSVYAKNKEDIKNLRNLIQDCFVLSDSRVKLVQPVYKNII